MNFVLTQLLKKSTVACLSLALFCGTAKAETILDFEDLYPGYENVGYLPSGYAGFTWTTDSAWVTKYCEGESSGYDFGTNGHVALFTAWESSVSFGNAEAFNFTGAFVTSAWNITQDVTVEGYLDGALQYSETITTHNDQAYWFAFDFKKIDELRFIPLEGIDADPSDGAEGDHLIIDDIHLFFDQDEDGIEDKVDNCPSIYNPYQLDADQDNVGDACVDDGNTTDSYVDEIIFDQDGDGIEDEVDNCLSIYNPDQSDADQDNVGDACDDPYVNDGNTTDSYIDVTDGASAKRAERPKTKREKIFRLKKERKPRKKDL